MLRLVRQIRFYSKLKGLPINPYQPPVKAPQATPIAPGLDEEDPEKEQGHRSPKHEAAKATSSSPPRAGGRIAEILRSITYGATVFVVFHLLWTYAYALIFPHGASMLPTFRVAGECFILSKLHRRGKDVRVGDIVTFTHPLLNDTQGLKRVIGMPGDFVLSQTPEFSDQMIQVPDGHCFVVGDNVPYSRDSRHFGPLPMALITGKVIAQVLPFHRRRWIRDPLVPA